MRRNHFKYFFEATIENTHRLFYKFHKWQSIITNTFFNIWQEKYVSIDTLFNIVYYIVIWDRFMNIPKFSYLFAHFFSYNSPRLLFVTNLKWKKTIIFLTILCILNTYTGWVISNSQSLNNYNMGIVYNTATWLMTYES